MTTGRKPKPKHLRVVEGNPGKRSLPDRAPEPKRVMPPKPKNLSKRQSDLWDRLADTTFKMGVLTEADGLALSMLCEAWGDFEAAKDILKQFGTMTYETPATSGGTLQRLHPAVGIKERADARVRAWCSEFGLTPAARVRVQKAIDDDEGEGGFNLDAMFTGESG